MMDAMFVAGAARLAGFAGAVLGWSPAAFWRATPAELVAVVEALAGRVAGGAMGGGAMGGDLAPPDPGVMARLQEAFPDG